jgi:hypothetical protein
MFFLLKQLLILMKSRMKQGILLLGTALVIAGAAAAIYIIYLLSPKDLIMLESPIPGLGSQFRMKAVKLDPPFLFLGDKPQNGNPPYFWTTSPLMALNLTPEMVSERFDESYLKAYGTPKLHRPPPDVFVAVYFGITIAAEDTSYIVIGAAFADDKSKIPARANAVSVLKKYGNQWKRTDPPEWVSRLPWTNFSEIEKISESGKATLDKYNFLKAVP